MHFIMLLLLQTSTCPPGVFLVAGKESACNAEDTGDAGSIPG